MRQTELNNLEGKLKRRGTLWTIISESARWRLVNEDWKGEQIYAQGFHKSSHCVPFGESPDGGAFRSRYVRLGVIKEKERKKCKARK